MFDGFQAPFKEVEVGGMVETKLVLDLGLFLEEVVKNFRMLTKTEGQSRPPLVVDGYLPPKRSTNADDFPFVIVRAEGGVSQMGQTSVEVSFIIGSYTTETDGYAYCLEIMQRIRTALCQLPNQTLNARYQLEFPIEWRNVPDQPYPQWLIEMTTHWVMNTPALTDF